MKKTNSKYEDQLNRSNLALKKQYDIIEEAKLKYRELLTTHGKIKCPHVYDDGSCAEKVESHWAYGEITEYIHPITGETETHDDGHTESSRVCQICNQEVE